MHSQSSTCAGLLSQCAAAVVTVLYCDNSAVVILICQQACFVLPRVTHEIMTCLAHKILLGVLPDPEIVDSRLNSEPIAIAKKIIPCISALQPETNFGGE